MRISATGIRSLWLSASAAGLGVGAWLALLYFPEAGFAKHPTGSYQPILFWFAACLAVPFAVFQAIALVVLFSNRLTAALIVAALWIPVTVGGVMAMVLPLWAYDATLYMFIPIAVVLPVLPGAVLIAVLQWFVMSFLGRPSYTWAVLTVAGVILGTGLGLLVGLMSVVWPMEIVWGTVTGAGIGLFQGQALLESLRAD